MILAAAPTPALAVKLTLPQLRRLLVKASTPSFSIPTRKS